MLSRLAPGGSLLADKAYDTDAIRAEAVERGAFANVPPRTIRKPPFHFFRPVRQTTLTLRLATLKPYHPWSNGGQRRWGAQA